MESMVRKLANGVDIPSIGFGTYKLGEEQEVIDKVKLALNLGYRQIDTASFYGNEEGVGKGIAKVALIEKIYFL